MLIKTRAESIVIKVGSLFKQSLVFNFEPDARVSLSIPIKTPACADARVSCLPTAEFPLIKIDPNKLTFADSANLIPQPDWSKSSSLIKRPIACYSSPLSLFSITCFMWRLRVRRHKSEHQTLRSTRRWLQMVGAVLSDGLLFTLPPPGLTVSTCKGQDQRPLSWCVFTRLAESERSLQLEKWGRGGPVPITQHFSCLAKSPQDEPSQNSRQIHRLCIRSLSPSCCLITEGISLSFLCFLETQRRVELGSCVSLSSAFRSGCQR